MTNRSTPGTRLIAIRDSLRKTIDENGWHEIGVLTDCDEIVSGHDRLLRSLRFGDPDYSGAALDVLSRIARRNSENIEILDDYARSKVEGDGISISSTLSDGPKFVFKPQVFTVPAEATDPDLVAAMMPFSQPFAGVYEAIKAATHAAGMKCSRADDIWNHSVIVEDIFHLICRAHIVVCDLTGKNPNVFYEMGIAHALGKHVIPITQSQDDVPFDLRHHRFIQYLNNGEGHRALETDLTSRIRTLHEQS